jgi:hypothetical protein
VKSVCLIKYHTMKIDPVLLQAPSHEDVGGNGSRAPHINLGNRRWVVSFTHQPPYHRERTPGNRWMGGWVDSRSGLETASRIWCLPTILRQFLNPNWVICLFGYLRLCMNHRALQCYSKCERQIGNKKRKLLLGDVIKMPRLLEIFTMLSCIKIHVVHPDPITTWTQKPLQEETKKTQIRKEHTTERTYYSVFTPKAFQHCLRFSHRIFVWYKMSP